MAKDVVEFLNCKFDLDDGSRSSSHFFADTCLAVRVIGAGARPAQEDGRPGHCCSLCPLHDEHLAQAIQVGQRQEQEAYLCAPQGPLKRIVNFLSISFCKYIVEPYHNPILRLVTE